MLRGSIAAVVMIGVAGAAADAAAQVRLRADGSPPAAGSALDDLALDLTGPEPAGDFAFTAPPRGARSWQDDFVLQSLHGVEAELLRGPNFAAGLSARTTPGRRDHLPVAGPERPGRSFGAFGEIFFDKWTIAARVGQDLADGEGGFVADLGIRWAAQILEGLTVELGSGLSWADGGYLGRYYGGGRPAGGGLRLYDPSPGLKDVTVSGSLTYAITDNWTVGGILGAQRMLGPAADSPLITDSQEYFGGLSFDYRF